jgi:hypothetical protein
MAIFLWMINILATLQKEEELYLIILRKIKTCNSTKVEHILCKKIKL